MVRAGEDRGVAFVIAANFHAAMPASVQKDVDAAVSVSSENDRLFTHTRRDVVARLGNLTLVSDEQPGTSKDLFLLLLIQVVVDKNLTADQPLFDIHERRHRVA
jgi:hypothetical protein